MKPTMAPPTHVRCTKRYRWRVKTGDKPEEEEQRQCHLNHLNGFMAAGLKLENFCIYVPWCLQMVNSASCSPPKLILVVIPIYIDTHIHSEWSGFTLRPLTRFPPYTLLGGWLAEVSGVGQLPLLILAGTNWPGKNLPPPTHPLCFFLKVTW